MSIGDSTVRAPRAVQTPATRHCASCGDALHGKHGKRYCNATCRAMAHRTRKTAEARRILQALKDIVAKLEELGGGE